MLTSESHIDEKTNSLKLYEQAQALMPGGDTRHAVKFPPFPVYAASGRGCYICDVDGVERIDFINNFSAQIHGHSHPAITATIIEQAKRLTSAILPTESEIMLAGLLKERTPGIDKVRFCNSGTEAVMIALKAARAYTGRNKILKMEGAFHGQYPEMEVSFYALPDRWGDVSAPARLPFSRGTPPGLLENIVLTQFNDIELTRDIISENAGDLAAVIIDPLPSRMQFIMPGIEFLTMLREETRDKGIALIFDEVFSFRAGYHGAQGVYGVIPDMTTLGKIIGGGLPIGAVGGTDEVMAVFLSSDGHSIPDVFHSGTFTANPMSMAAGLCAMKLMTEEAFATLANQGERLRKGLSDAAMTAGVDVQITGFGSMTAVSFCKEPFSSYREMICRTGNNYRDTLFQFHKNMLNNGVIIGPQGLFVGSTPMTNTEIDITISVASKAFTELAKQRNDTVS